MVILTKKSPLADFFSQYRNFYRSKYRIHFSFPVMIFFIFLPCINFLRSYFAIEKYLNLIKFSWCYSFLKFHCWWFIIIFRYYSLVAVLQYLLPSILLIFLALIYKSASGLTFYGPLQPQWENPNGMDKLPAGSWAVLFKFLIWLVSSSHALAVIGGYAFHSIIDTDL